MMPISLDVIDQFDQKESKCGASFGTENVGDKKAIAHYRKICTRILPILFLFQGSDDLFHDEFSLCMAKSPLPTTRFCRELNILQLAQKTMVPSSDAKSRRRHGISGL